MKKLYLLTLICTFLLTNTHAQQDCCTATPIPGPLSITVPSNSGNGTFEQLNGCSCLASNEHDSYWFSFECTASGTFEMMITPANLGADFDFALYGVSCPCDAGTVVVSCDYTGPISPPGPFVPTGISSTPMATFGVPGATEFQPTVTLTAGTVYYIIADNITTNGSGFTIEFAGTAGIGPPPFVGVLPPPGPLSGDLTTCPGATLTYSVPDDPNLTNYEWSVDPPAGGISGNGGSSVDITFDDAGVYTVCVEGSASCQTTAPTCVVVEVTPIVTQPMTDIICIGGVYFAPDGQFFTDPGVYDLQFTSYQGCDSTVQLILDPVPFSITILVEEICDGDCVTFGGESLCQSGVYEEILTNQFGCDSTVTLNLIVVPNEAIITGGGTISCNGNPVVLNGSGSIGGANMTFQWTNQNGQVVGNSPTLTVTTPGDYTLTTNSTVSGNTCTDQATVNVAANNSPPAGITATGGVIDCSSSSIMLMGNSTSPGVIWAWAGPGGFSSNQQNPTVSVTGTYTLTVTGTNGCTGTATAQVAGDSNLPNASANGDTLTCTQTSAMLSGNSTTAGVTWAWTGPGGFSSNQQNPTVSMPGTYTLTVTASNGCSAQASALVVENVATPAATATGGMLSCTQPDLTLNGSSATPGVGYSWTGPGGFSSNQQNPVVSQPGIYTLTVTATNGCTMTATANVTQDANTPDVTAAGGLLDCENTTLNLQGSSTTTGVTWAWTGPGGFSSTVQNPGVSAPGTYTLTVTATNGCTASATTAVTQDVAQPNASATGGTLTCTTGSITLQGNSTSPNVTFSWTGPGGFSSSQQNPTASQTGTYILTVTAANGCTATASAQVQQDAGVPDVSADGGTLDCNISTVQLNGGTLTAGAIIAWTGPGGFTSTLEDPTVSVAGSYVLTVTAPNNCTAQATALVVLNNQPPDAQAVGDTLTCNATSVMLAGSSATPGAMLEWTGPGGFTSTTPNPTVSLTGNYTLTVTGANGCTATTSATVEEDANLPDASATGGQLNCDFTEILLHGNSLTAGVTFAWTGPGGFNADQQDTLVSLAGDYLLTVTSPNGCTNTAIATVMEDIQAPDVSAIGGILSCDFPSIAMTGSSGTTGVAWSWTGPGGFTSNQQNPMVSIAGNYTLTVTAANGCTASDGATVAQDANLPNATATGGTLTCDATSVQLTGNSTNTGVSYGWTGPGGFTSSLQNPIASQSGTYALTVTAANGCTATTSATVNQDITAPDASANGGTLTCTAGTLTLSGNSTTPGVTWAWTGPGSFTSTAQNPVIMTAGAYVLTVTGANGCTVTATAQVNADANTPNVSANGGQLNCNNPQIQLTGNSTTTGVTWAWTGPGGFTSSEQNPAVAIPGIYTLTVTAPNGCTHADDATVNQNLTPPNASATGGQITCQTPSATLNGNSTTPNVDYEWTGPGGFTSMQQNPVVTTGGTYALTVTASNGCTATATTQVLVDADVPSAQASGDVITCLETSAQLTGSSNQPDVTWAWAGPGGFTSDEQNPSVTVAGAYTLTITTPNGCSATANATVAEDVDLPTITISTPAQLDCVTEMVTLDANGSDAGTGFSLQWSTANGNFVSGENTLTPEVDAPGIYTLGILNQNNGCLTSENVEVSLSSAAPSGAAIVSSDPACFGDNNGVILIGNVTGGTPPYTYSLDNQPFGTNNNFTNLAPGLYTVWIKDNTGCEWETSITLSTPLEVAVSLDAVGLEAEVLPLGESVELNAVIPTPLSLLQSIAWTPEELATGCDLCTSVTVTPTETTAYSVTITDLNGCTATDALTIPVNRQRPVYVPNAFSPNDDGINDVLMVFAGKSVVGIRSFLVFSRWGETIYQFYNFAPNDPAYGWDGTHRGKKLDPSVFTWFAEVEFIDGEVKIFEGDVVLVR